MSTFCKSCGGRSKEGSKFCSACGDALESDVLRDDLELTANKDKFQNAEIHSSKKIFYGYSPEERENLRNEDETFISTGLKDQREKLNSSLITIIISSVLIIGSIGINLWRQLYLSTVVGDSWTFFMKWGTFILMVVIVIGVVIVFELLVHKKYDKEIQAIKQQFNQITPYETEFKQNYCYYVPFERDITEADRAAARTLLKPNTKVYITDPFYVSTITPNWTLLVGDVPSYISWVPYENVLSKFQGYSGASFAILPLSYVSPIGGNFIARVFFRNTYANPISMNLEYYRFMPTNDTIKLPTTSLLSFKVNPNTVVFKDIIIATTTTHSKSMKGNLSQNALYFITRSVSSSTSHYIVVKTRTTEISGRIQTILPYMVNMNINVNQLINDAPQSLDYIGYLGLGLNPFVAPNGMKDILMYSLTRGEPLSKHQYMEYAILKPVIQELRFYTTIFLAIAALSAVIVQIVSISVGGVDFWTIVFAIGVIILFIYERKKLNRFFPSAQNTVTEPCKMGLTISDNYTSYQDRRIRDEDLEIWKQNTSTKKISEEYAYPVDFTRRREEIMTVAQELIVRYPQYLNHFSEAKKKGNLEILEG